MPKNAKQLGPYELLSRFPINLDAILWSSLDNVIYDMGCMESIDKREINIFDAGLSERHKYSEVAHIIIAYISTEFSLSEHTVKYLHSALSELDKDKVLQTIVNRNPDYEKKAIEFIKKL